MKLRMRGNSVRVRLTQSEVADLAAGKSVEQTTEITATSVFKTLVNSSGRVQCPTVTFEGSCLAIVLPLETVRRWAESGQVSIESSQPIDALRSLEILVEKDFECLHSRDEADVDAFPNPKSVRKTPPR